MLLNRAAKLVCPLVMILVMTVVGCGKKAENSDSSDRRQEPVEENDTQIEQMLEKQVVECENGLSCPSGIAKIAIVDRNKLKFCTGFLVNSLTVATSSSCLTQSLRLSSDRDRCSKDVHIFFPRSGFYSQRRVGCKSLLLVSDIAGKDPTLWRNDVSYIELSEPVSRRLIRHSREGLEDGQTFNLWKVDVVNDEVGIVRKEVCTATTKTYVNPLAESKFSPVVTVAGCEYQAGNTGAPLLGPQGRMRGILSQPLDSAMTNFLNNSGMMIEPLSKLVHTSNGACMPSLISTDPVTERDCLKDLDQRQQDVRRGDMLSTETPYQTSRGAIQDQVNAVRPYFQWDVKLERNQDNSYGVKIAPKCMNPLNEWIDQVGKGTKRYTYSMVLPAWRLMLGFDRVTRLSSRLDDSMSQKIFVQFSPKNAWNTKKTEISVWREGSQGSTITIRLCDALDEDFPSADEEI